MFKLIKSTKSQNNYDIELYHNNVSSKKNILIIGCFHGDEPQGYEIISDYLKLNHSCQNSLYFIPCLNPDGLNLNSRVNANGVDLNRNFPTQNWEKTEKNEFFGGDSAASEIETKFMCDILESFKNGTTYNLDLILTIHAPFKIVNFDGPALETAKTVSRIMKYPIESDIGYPTPGSFGTYAGIERNIPTITLELGEDEDIDSLKQRCFELFDFLALN